MMKPPGAAPAVAAAKNGLVAMIGLDPFQLPGDQVQGDLPRHFDEGFLAAQLRMRTRLCEITATHRRAQDPRRRGDGFGNRGTDGRRIRVPLHRSHRFQLSVDDLRAVGPPMHGSETHGAMDSL
ncbi:hypothetical protein D3C87_1801990 [compost metagenome]